MISAIPGNPSPPVPAQGHQGAGFGDGVQAQQQQQQQQQQNSQADFFLSYYRLGKTLGIGSFGKVRAV